jgi:FkbM family methyltransferase
MQNRLAHAATSVRKYFALFGIRGLLRRALIEFPGTNSEFRAPIPHSSEHVFIRLGTTDVAAYEHALVNEEYGFHLAGSPSIIVDAGANVGMTAVYFSRRYPTAKIIAVEPDAGNFAILKKNAQLFPRIYPVNAALWNSDGLVQLQDGGAGSWGMRVSTATSRPAGFVRSLRLRTLLDEHNIDKVDLLKLDVEGSECEILEDAVTWLRRVDVLCAELHDRFRPGCSEIFESSTAEFPVRWRRGELVCVAREGAVTLK